MTFPPPGSVPSCSTISAQPLFVRARNVRNHFSCRHVSVIAVKATSKVFSRRKCSAWVQRHERSKDEMEHVVSGRVGKEQS